MTNSQIANQVSKLRAAMEKREWSPFRKYVASVVDNAWFSSFILGVIVINTIMIACQTDKPLLMKYGTTGR